jgi:acyl-CoA oxidase
MIGCYAQTEMGHGSDVQSLETTAIFHAPSDSFIINSPTLTSTKMWPGDLGIFSTHAMVFAQLNIGGKKCGVQAFLVPIRDMETHEPLEGIEAGDIGPKCGYGTKVFFYLLKKNIP